jgi:hypothetical protein
MRTPTPNTDAFAPVSDRSSLPGVRRRAGKPAGDVHAFARLLGTRVRSRSGLTLPEGAPARHGANTPPAVRAPEAAPYAGIIAEAARENGLDPNLLTEVIRAESGFNPRAVSPAGAKGLMQLMDATAKSLGVRDPFDPVENIRAGARYLSRLLHRYGGDVRRALAAYNAGPGAVDRYGGIPPYAETQRYVEKAVSRLPGAPAGRSGPVHIFGEERPNPWGPGWSPFLPSQDRTKLDPWRPGWQPELPALGLRPERS